MQEEDDQSPPPNTSFVKNYGKKFSTTGDKYNYNMMISVRVLGSIFTGWQWTAHSLCLPPSPDLGHPHPHWRTQTCKLPLAWGRQPAPSQDTEWRACQTLCWGLVMTDKAAVSSGSLNSILQWGNNNIMWDLHFLSRNCTRESDDSIHVCMYVCLEASLSTMLASF